MIERFTQIVATHLLLVDAGQILLARRFNTGYEDGNYSLPAGHVEANETAVQALIREAKEEIGIIIQPADLRFAHVMHRNQGEHRIDFFFTANRWQGEPQILEPDKCDELLWALPSKLPNNTILYIKQAITSFDQNKFYSELGF